MFDRLKSRFRKGTTDHDGDGKMGGSMKETDDMAKVAPKRPVAKKAKPATTTARAPAPKRQAERDAEQQAAFDQGKHARAVAIGRDSDPHGKASKLQEHWLAGWDAEDELRQPMAEHEARVAKAQAERQQALADEAAKAAADAEKRRGDVSKRQAKA